MSKTSVEELLFVNHLGGAEHGKILCGFKDNSKTRIPMIIPSLIENCVLGNKVSLVGRCVQSFSATVI